MSRYLLFSGIMFHPKGGGNDFIDSYGEFEDARTEAMKSVKDLYGYKDKWANIFDSKEMKVIREYQWYQGSVKEYNFEERLAPPTTTLL